jgi:hypothetical protein
MIKKILLSATFAAAAWQAGAQTNGGFETWGSSAGQPQEPNGWITANLFASPLLTFPSPNPNDTSAFRIGTPNQAIGQYSMKIETVVLQYNPDPSTIPDTLGIALEGSVQTTPTFLLIDRIQYTARPANFHYKFKYVPNGNDTGWCYIELSKWNGSSRDIIADGYVAHFGSTTSWTDELTSLNYYMSGFPDSLSIAYSSSGLAPRVGSALWLDDLYFMGWNSVEDVYANASFVKAYPNPASDMITIGTELDNASALKVYDAVGKLVGTYALNNKRYVLYTADWRAGNYYYSVMDKEGTVLAGNTFSVVR